MGLVDNLNLIVVIFLIIILLSFIVGFQLLFIRLKNLNIKINHFEKSSLEAYDKLNVMSDQIELNSKDIVLNLKELKEVGLINFEKNVKSTISDINSNIEKYIKTQDGHNIDIHTKLDNYNSNIVSSFKELKELDLVNFEKNINANIDNIDSSIEKYIKVQDKYSINIQTRLDNHNLNITKLVNHLRVDNLINLTQEINKYKQGIYDDEYFLQEVGFCKIIKFTDKQTKDITEVFYNDYGEKDHTKTYDKENRLLFSMQYEKGKLKLGKEFDKNGNEIFEYFYDDAEEIAKKIEYIYDKDLKFIKKEEVNYKE